MELDSVSMGDSQRLNLVGCVIAGPNPPTRSATHVNDTLVLNCVAPQCASRSTAVSELTTNSIFYCLSSKSVVTDLRRAIPPLM
jgi:hypothetical protein